MMSRITLHLRRTAHKQDNFNSSYDLTSSMMTASGRPRSPIAFAHRPDSSSCSFPPLKKHSRLLTGPGSTESDVYPFDPWGWVGHGSGFLKLFVSTT